MSDFLLRREPFGGVLCNTADNDNVMFVNHHAFFILKSISAGMQDSDIEQRYLNGLGVPDRPIGSSISKYRRLLNDKRYWADFLTLGDEETSIDLEADTVPALHMPLDFYWETTRKCNLRCVHCYNNSGPNGAHPRHDDVQKVFSDIEGVSFRVVTLSGGEVLLRTDLPNILRRIRMQAHCLMVGTNGTLLNDEMADLVGENCDFVNLSVDAPFSEDYDNFRGKPGSFADCIKGAKMLVDRGVSVIAQTTISHYNIDTLERLANYLLDLGVRQWSCRFPFFTGQITNNRDVFLSKEEQLKRRREVESLYERYHTRFDDMALGMSIPWSFDKPYKPTVNRNSPVTCAAGTVLGVLHADGTMAPCQLFSETSNKSAPIWDSSIYEQWQNADCFKRMRSIRLHDLTPCSTCSNANHGCGGGCRARAYIRDGHLNGNDSECGYRSEYRHLGDKALAAK
jgi:radical SAM protein with 4Fe4S-binding SPASM domain